MAQPTLPVREPIVTNTYRDFLDAKIRLYEAGFMSDPQLETIEEDVLTKWYANGEVYQPLQYQGRLIDDRLYYMVYYRERPDQPWVCTNQIYSGCYINDPHWAPSLFKWRRHYGEENVKLVEH
jgi:hypothetical protein